MEVTQVSVARKRQISKALRHLINLEKFPETRPARHTENPKFVHIIDLVIPRRQNTETRGLFVLAALS